MIYRSNSPKETQKIASNLAKTVDNRLRKSVIHRGVVIALEGELGAGKTTFVQGFAKALGVKSNIQRPTFNIIKKYPISSNGYSLMAICYLYHIDCYRLKDHKEAMPLGIKDIFEEPDCFVLIEWPERISKILPKKLTKVHIDHIAPSKRKITIKK